MSWHLQPWTPFRAEKWSDIDQVKAKEVPKVRYWKQWFFPLQGSKLHSLWYSDQLREMVVICQKEGWQRRNLCNNEKPPQPTQRGALPFFHKIHTPVNVKRACAFLFDTHTCTFHNNSCSWTLIPKLRILYIRKALQNKWKNLRHLPL